MTYDYTVDSEGREIPDEFREAVKYIKTDSEPDIFYKPPLTEAIDRALEFAKTGDESCYESWFKENHQRILEIKREAPEFETFDFQSVVSDWGVDYRQAQENALMILEAMDKHGFRDKEHLASYCCVPLDVVNELVKGKSLLSPVYSERLNANLNINTVPIKEFEKDNAYMQGRKHAELAYLKGMLTDVKGHPIMETAAKSRIESLERDQALKEMTENDESIGLYE